MDKNETLFNVAAARQYCEKLDKITENIRNSLDEIDKEKGKYYKKINKFNKMGFVKMYLLISLLAIPPFSLITIFVDLHMEILLYPIVTLIITLIAKQYYQKKKVPTLIKTQEQIKKNKEKELDNLISNLYEECESYDLMLSDFPKELHFTAALDIIHGAIQKDYVSTIKTGIIFYNNHLKKIKADTTEESKQLIKEINESIKTKKQREEIIEKYIKISNDF